MKQLVGNYCNVMAPSLFEFRIFRHVFLNKFIAELFSTSHRSIYILFKGKLSKLSPFTDNWVLPTFQTAQQFNPVSLQVFPRVIMILSLLSATLGCNKLCQLQSMEWHALSVIRPLRPIKVKG